MRRLFVTCDFPPMTGGQSNYFKNLWLADALPGDIFLVPGRCRQHCQVMPGHSFAYMPVPGSEGTLARIIRSVAVLFSCLFAYFRMGPLEFHAGQVLAGGISGLVLNKLFKVPYVVYVFGADVLEFREKAWGNRVIRAVLGNCRHIIACSNFTADLVRSAFVPTCPVSVILPGVEDRFFSPDTTKAKAFRETYGLTGKKIVLTVGRLVERKGHESVVRALPLVLKRLPETHYVIAGEGPNHHSLKTIARESGVDDHVTFLGSVSDNDLPAIYALADLFIMLPKLMEHGDIEGFGIVYLEASASGLPVIASRNGGVVDAVIHNKTGILIDEPVTPEKIADAVVHMIENPFQFSGEAVRRARELSWTNQRAAWRKTLEIT
ncbi:MAG: hypothetical protein A2350_01170 [Candidatus Raymondbacteria bacterium RifOxyB12_full_50_8]|uniref:Glycosyl transferase family 1 domain-containing protein n=1 Tax=Candidatus Raymondbacteria bacterium RIFOXYD12_FULL_49_13 TaxID=1817890 RepID=A0A1F7F1P8_UNCRA|nr:MAG: hypothetical protein A2248_07545 [Candidatus Raymondbacteria bacterium RIFOXYA2_FULL_49_16]OGJ88760.1 MAG: hypothetical protein A2350_01170 [Candidatus Raymondbacteria bacterium RifOxyB12_full_50_8]OGJ96121.1 MAG: hypothetical protein A2453_09400 [Candidatus Raymondbacteria bacterium RIFOXYC2_FULL_50_21]OGK00584.1 MAG: hypothetical protein A2519_21610 [Candidatus Raymondbacteria bacterium RIFOXYD12_FULL_49_13]OGP41128.1 MAG: hypothetical protein A2324_09795 [Candidatus Raymondbacteria b